MKVWGWEEIAVKVIYTASKLLSLKKTELTLEEKKNNVVKHCETVLSAPLLGKKYFCFPGLSLIPPAGS